MSAILTELQNVARSVLGTLGLSDALLSRGDVWRLALPVLLIAHFAGAGLLIGWSLRQASGGAHRSKKSKKAPRVPASARDGGPGASGAPAGPGPERSGESDASMRYPGHAGPHHESMPRFSSRNKVHPELRAEPAQSSGAATPAVTPRTGVRPAGQCKSETDADGAEWPTRVELRRPASGPELGVLESPGSSVASPEQIQALCTALPLRHQQSRWRLLYSTALHGISLNTLFRRGANRSPCVTLVRDMQGHVFGCYASEPWQRHARYYGDGETFVFRLSPGPVEAFKWDQNSQEPNQFFQLAQPDAIALGGGTGFALRIDGDLKWGASRASTTFKNPSLSAAEDFMVDCLELWWLSRI